MLASSNIRTSSKRRRRRRSAQPTTDDDDDFVVRALSFILAAYDANVTAHSLTHSLLLEFQPYVDTAILTGLKRREKEREGGKEGRKEGRREVVQKEA